MSARSGTIQTVAGPIAPDRLGPTLMHEHLLWDIRNPAARAATDQGPDLCLCNYYNINLGIQKAPNNRQLSDKALVMREVVRMREAGGRAIVELS